MENNYELFHWGVKGQKWGVRRYQNKDGSLTAAGKKRLRAKDMSDEELGSKVKRLTMEKTYNKLSKESEGPSKVEKTKKVVDATSRLVDETKKIERDTSPKPTKKRMNLDNMTDQQLRERINRENLERQYSELFGEDAAPKVSKGREYARNTLEAAGSVLAITGSALGIALAIKELKG